MTDAVNPRGDAVLAVDVGTSGVRAVAVTVGLAVVGIGTAPLAVAYDDEGGAVQDPRRVLAAVREAMGRAAAQARAAGRRIAAACIGVTASSLLLLDARGEPVTFASLWADTRARAEVPEVRERFGLALYRRTGCPAHASYWPAKLRWMQRAGGDGAPGPGRLVASLKDYLLLHLTGIRAVDYTVAATSGLLDLQAMAWDEEVLDWLGIEPGLLPAVVSPLERFPLRNEVARAAGLDPGMPVLAGSMDGMLAHIGAGCVAPGAMTSMFGSSAALRVTDRRPRLDPRGRTWCYPVLDDFWVAGGASNNGGNVMEWLAELLGSEGGESGEGGREGGIDALVRAATQGPPGARGLTFLPYLLGERSPLWDEGVSGALLGLRLTHRRADVAQAVLEGLCFGLYEVFCILQDLAPRPSRIVAGGGYTKSPGWLQMQADVFGVPVAVTGFSEASAMGAAVLAWHGIAGEDLAALADRVPVAEVYEPDADHHASYRDVYAGFLEARRRHQPETAEIPGTGSAPEPAAP